jgi:hypothetical protein
MHTKREPPHPALWGYRLMFRAGIGAARHGSDENLRKEKLGKGEYLLPAGSVGQGVRASNMLRATSS